MYWFLNVCLNLKTLLTQSHSTYIDNLSHHLHSNYVFFLRSKISFKILSDIFQIKFMACYQREAFTWLILLRYDMNHLEIRQKHFIDYNIWENKKKNKREFDGKKQRSIQISYFQPENLNISESLLHLNEPNECDSRTSVCVLHTPQHNILHTISWHSN